ncbi:MAG: IgA Peptidase M64, partial [Gemmatimonadota bacterium]|nr:IgA Peptidase M64 [Gemmatimonadota bacterium]
MVTRPRLLQAAAIVTVIAIGAAAATASSSVPDFDRFFIDKTMRVDYFHTGSAPTEIISLDRVVSDGPWAGSRTKLIDGTNLGKYLFEVHDAATGTLVYSRGYASIYGEWETTAEASETSRTFHESLRFPWPRSPVRIVLKKRDDHNRFIPFAELAVDPAARAVNPADLPPVGTLWDLLVHGAPQNKVDLVLLGEGYTAAELPTFHDDARRLVDRLFAYEPFKSRRSDFNVRAIDLPGAESGVSRPHGGKYRRNPVSTQYGIFDSERYVLTLNNRALRDVVSAVPYEFVVILVNEKQYGGGGIYNSHSTAAVGSAFADYLFVHEFGHHFAGLGDEYYTSPVAYETGGEEFVEPWEPNITALRDT